MALERLTVDLQKLERRVERLETLDSPTSVAAVAAGGAPVGAQYVVMAYNGALTQERLLQATAILTVTDGGANNPVTLAIGDYARGSVIRAGAAEWEDLVHPGANYIFGTDANDALWKLAATSTPIPPVAQGDIIIADAVPAWSILTVGAQFTHLEAGAATATWVANLTMQDDAWIGAAANDVRVEFDSSNGFLKLGLGDAAGADRVQVLDSGDVVKAYIDSDGNADFDGHIAVGSTAGTPNANRAATIEEDFTNNAGFRYAVRARVNFSPTGNFTSSPISESFRTTLKTAQQQTDGVIYGVNGAVQVDNGIAASDLRVIGIFCQIDIEDADAQYADTLRANTPAVDTGTIDEGNGVHITQGAKGGAATYTLLHGLLIENINAAGTAASFAIKTHKGNIVFNDGQDANTDFTVKAAGVADALIVDGAAGQITLGALTAGSVQSSAGGILSVVNPAITYPIAPVAQGDMLVADATPAWTILTLGAAAGYALVSTATTAVWDLTPSWLGDHTWTSATSAKPVLTIENTNADGQAPTIDFYKNTASPLDGDDLGAIDFFGETSTGAKDRYAFILAESLDVTNADTGGGLRFTVVMDATERNLFEIAGYNGAVNQGEVIVNQDGQDVDFRVEGVGAVNALVVQGSDGFVGVGTNAPANALHVRVSPNPQVLIERTIDFDVTLGIKSPSTDWAIGWDFSEGNFAIAENADLTANQRLVIEATSGNVGVNVAAPTAQLHIDQSAAAGAKPCLILDQGDASEQCIQFSGDGADQDIFLFTVDVTGTPTLLWDESEDALIISGADLHMNNGAVDTLKIRRGGDVSNVEADFYANANMGIAADSSIYVFIDANNDSANVAFVIAKDAENVAGATEVFRVNEDGDVAIIDDAWIGFGPAAGRIEFDDQATDEINFLSCNVGIGTPTPGQLFHVFEAAANTVVDVETNLVNGQAVVRFLNDAQTWQVGVNASDSYQIRDVTGTTNVVIIEAGAPAASVYIDSSGDVLFGVSTPTTANGGNVLVVGDNAADPTMAANTAGFYGKNVAGTVEAFAVDEAGNAAQLTPHNFTLFDPDPSHGYPWSYYAKNEFIGKEINVDMYGAIKAIEALTGGQFIFERDIPKRAWPTEKPPPAWILERMS